MAVPNKIRVKVIKSPVRHWYNEGEIYQVLNHISFNWDENVPYFELNESTNGIPVENCEILGRGIPEYTMKELKEKVGHEFIIK